MSCEFLSDSITSTRSWRSHNLSSHGMSPEAAQAYWEGVETRLRQVPGIRNVAITSLPPFGNRVWVNREGTIFYHVTPAYFETMQIPLRRGRVFSTGEPGVVLVSEALARRRWPAGDAHRASVRGPHRHRSRRGCAHGPGRRSVGDGVLLPDRVRARWRKRHGRSRRRRARQCGGDRSRRHAR